MASHIVLRNRVWHYNRKVPDDVQPFVRQRWWKESLKTGDKREAETKARAIAVQHDQFIADIRNKPERQRLEELETAAAALRQNIKDEVFKRLDAGVAALRRGGIDALKVGHPEQVKVAAVVKDSTGTARRFQEQHSLISDYTLPAVANAKAAMFAAAGERLPTLPDDVRNAVEAAGGIEGLRAAAARDLVSPPPEDDSDAAIIARHRSEQRTQLLKKVGIEGIVRPDDPKNPRVNTAMEAWFRERKQGRAAVKRHRTSIRRFTELHGNVPVRDITKDMVRGYLKKIENLADHRRLPTNIRGGLADPDADVPRIAAPTVDRHLVSIKALLTYCLEQEWVPTNVATGLKAPKDTRPKASKRRSFTREERQKFLTTVTDEDGKDGDKAWFVRLTAYTGARLEEIAQLARSNVKIADGVWVIEIDDLDGREIKEEPRQVPIHTAIRDDFLAWVKEGRSDQLFASFRTKDGRFGNKLSGDMARLMDRAGLTDPRLVFHSLRHTLKREMTRAGVDPDVRRAVLGHKPRDAHEGYEGPDLETVAAELEKMPPLF